MYHLSAMTFLFLFKALVHYNDVSFYKMKTSFCSLLLQNATDDLDFLYLLNTVSSFKERKRESESESERMLISYEVMLIEFIVLYTDQVNK